MTVSQDRSTSVGSAGIKYIYIYCLDFIRPICLPTTDIALSKEPPMLVVSGWGAVDETKSSSNVKLHVELPYVKPEVSLSDIILILQI